MPAGRLWLLKIKVLTIKKLNIKTQIGERCRLACLGYVISSKEDGK